jgi:serine O-acetyltransferase
MHVVDDRIENMCKALHKVNSEYQNGELPPLQEEDFDCVRDDDEVRR